MQIIKIIHCRGCGAKYIDENIEENYTFGLLLPSGVRSMNFLDLLDVNFDYEERRTCSSCGSSVCRVKRRFYHTPEIIIFQLLYSSLRRINNTPKDMNIGKWLSNPNVDDKSTYYCLKSMTPTYWKQ